MINDISMEFPSLEELKQNIPRKEAAPAERTILQVPSVNKARKITRVAAYARVSTEMEDQDGSIEMQCRHYEEVIRSHPGWELVGIYHERVSGTHRENRPQMNRLLRECRRHRVDLVLTKSISRFARSTSDLLWAVRALTDCGTRIYFESENMDTGTESGELLLTILASFAETEVRSISENNKWAIRRRFENGSYRYSAAPYGYDLQSGQLTVNEQEAAVVRDIFRMFLEGTGTSRIAAELNRRGIRTKHPREDLPGRGNGGRWTTAGICAILHNEFYTGDSLLQKNFHDEDFQLRVNRGELPMYYLEDHHAALIDRDTFEKADRILAYRSNAIKKGKDPSQEGTSFKPSSREAPSVFSRICTCGRCGGVLQKETVRRSGDTRVWWTCRRSPGRKRAAAVTQTPPCESIPEQNIRNAFVTVLNKLHYADVILLIHEEMLQAEWKSRHGDELASLRDRLRHNQELMKRLSYSKGRTSEDTPQQISQRNRLRAESARLGERLQVLELPQSGALQRLREIVTGWKGGDFPEQIFRETIDRVVVNSRTSFTFHFRCGLVLRE